MRLWVSLPAEAREELPVQHCVHTERLGKNWWIQLVASAPEFPSLDGSFHWKDRIERRNITHEITRILYILVLKAAYLFIGSLNGFSLLMTI